MSYFHNFIIRLYKYKVFKLSRSHYNLANVLYITSFYGGTYMPSVFVFSEADDAG